MLIKSRLLMPNVFKDMTEQARKQLGWDTRKGEEFSERGPNFLKYVQYFLIMSNTFFQGGRKIFLKQYALQSTGFIPYLHS